jgi:hypothetical protein
MGEIFNETEIIGISDKRKRRLTISGFESEQLWLTDISGMLKPNYQLMYSLGARVFINAFNNKLSMFKLQGIYVPETCSSSGNGKTPEFVRFYREKNITQSSDAKIAFEGISIKGSIVSMEIANYSKQGIDGHGFTLSFLGRLREAENSNSAGGVNLGSAGS